MLLHPEECTIYFAVPDRELQNNFDTGSFINLAKAIFICTFFKINDCNNFKSIFKNAFGIYIYFNLECLIYIKKSKKKYERKSTV